MNAIRCTLIMALLALSTGPLLAQDDADEAPQWTPGGHYTAELNLQTAELTLLPLTGDDQKIVARSACALPSNLDEGVYVMVSEANGWSLSRTHPEGVSAQGPAAITLAACTDTGNAADTLRLPAEALLAMENAAVGALYIHH